MTVFDDVETVVDNPLAFGEKLGIDPDAFSVFGLKKNLREFLLDSIAGTAEDLAHGIEEGFREASGEEITTEDRKEIAAEVGREIAAEVGREIAAKFGNEIASEVGVDVATELAAQIGAEIAGEAGAEIARASVELEVGVNIKRAKNTLVKYGRNVVGEIGGTAAGTVAASSLVAGTFFPATGILGFLGITTAATPIGWILAAGVGGGLLASWGYKQLFGRGEDDEFEVIPNFIKTPLDVAACRLFYFLCPFGLKVALADSTFAKDERRFISDYFHCEWGYSKEFIYSALIEIKENINQYDIVELTENLIKFKKDNPTCVYGNIPKELKSFLHAVMTSDGNTDLRELDIVNAIIVENESQLQDFWSDFLGSNVTTG